MTGTEVSKLTSEEIGVELVRLQRRVYDLRCQAATEKIEDPSQFKKVRRDIARLKTEQHRRAATATTSRSVVKA
jgi:large subunit ribosomal protein L29